ncbi:MAG: ABC transporter ATP-binding protein [Deltaproteobacteria bacterium]|jgi:putative ABC transport system ATP-binding protein|nr:ABC transporter ATP-binding protein [Deltaproteobacteria bacterium]
MKNELIKLQSLSKSFPEGDGERVVFRDLCATLQAGEFVVLLGRSGSGKSTLLNLISGIDLPTSGDVVIGEHCLTRLSEHQRTLFRRAHIGFIFQFYNLIPTLTVLENLLLPLELIGTSGAAAETQARQFLDQVGLLDRAASYPDRLSGGEQQRVAICRALIHRPLLLLADEPTGNLDAETGGQVLELLTRLARENHMTTLMVTHSAEIARLADRVLTIRDGQLVEQAKPQEEGR